MDKVKVSVTDYDIAKGQSLSGSCPIALAIKRIIVDTIYPNVSALGIMFKLSSTGAVQYQVDLPIDAKDFVYNFDEQNPVGPFDFEVDIPSFYLKHGEEIV